MTEPTPPDALDVEPEAVIEAAYLQAFKRLGRKLTALSYAVVLAAGVGGFAIWDVAATRLEGHNDTQKQIRTLVCLVIDKTPPDHGLGDKLRHDYHCGPYMPPKHPGVH